MYLIPDVFCYVFLSLRKVMRSSVDIFLQLALRCIFEDHRADGNERNAFPHRPRPPLNNSQLLIVAEVSPHLALALVGVRASRESADEFP